MVATPDGFTFLYDAGVGDFTVSRQDYTSSAGAYAAYRRYLLCRRLAAAQWIAGSYFWTVDSSSGQTSGFMVFSAGARAHRCGRLDQSWICGAREFLRWLSYAAHVTVEAPLLPFPTGSWATSSAPGGVAVPQFIRQPVESGLTLLASNYDAPLPQPMITSVASAADGVSGVASGGLISVSGSNLSTSTVASSTTPLPTVLGQ